MPSQRTKNAKTALVSLRVPNDIARMVALLVEIKAMTPTKVLTSLLDIGLKNLPDKDGAEAKRRFQAEKESALVAQIEATQAELEDFRDEWRS